MATGNPSTMTKKLALQITDELRPMAYALPDWTMAVDPGESVGMVWVKELGTIKARARWGDILVPITCTPDEALDRFARFCLEAREAGASPSLRIEEYRIFPNKLQAHSGQTIPTAENIGAFKYLAGRMGCRVTEQRAEIKQTTESLLKARGIPLLGGSRHSKDAELHLWYPVLRSNQKKAV